MSTLNILRKAIKCNSDLIYVIECGIIEAQTNARAFKADGEIAFAVEQYGEVKKLKRKLSKQVEVQKVFKVEIIALRRLDRIKRKYLKVFGHEPKGQMYTSYEQEAMLDQLLAEKAELVKTAAPATV